MGVTHTDLSGSWNCSDLCRGWSSLAWIIFQGTAESISTCPRCVSHCKKTLVPILKISHNASWVQGTPASVRHHPWASRRWGSEANKQSLEEEHILDCFCKFCKFYPYLSYNRSCKTIQIHLQSKYMSIIIECLCSALLSPLLVQKSVGVSNGSWSQVRWLYTHLHFDVPIPLPLHSSFIALLMISGP